MKTDSLEVLEKADVAPAQARAIVRAIEIEIAGATDTLATKHDLLLLRQDVFAETAKLRSEMVEMRAGFQTANADLRGELRAEIHLAVSGVVRQMYVAMVGQTAVMLGLTYFLVTQLR